MLDFEPESTPPAAVMLSIAAIAERDGVSRPAVSQKVARLVEQHGLHVDRDDRGRVAAVDVAQYDLLRDRLGDPSKDQRPERQAEPAADLNSYNEALRVKTWYEARQRGLVYAEQMAKVVRVDQLLAAANDAAEAITGTVRRLTNETDDLAAAVARDGSHGLRVALKAIEIKMLGEIADALAGLAKIGPQPAIDDE